MQLPSRVSGSCSWAIRSRSLSDPPSLSLQSINNCRRISRSRSRLIAWTWIETITRMKPDKICKFIFNLKLAVDWKIQLLRPEFILQKLIKIADKQKVKMHFLIALIISSPSKCMHIMLTNSHRLEIGGFRCSENLPDQTTLWRTCLLTTNAAIKVSSDNLSSLLQISKILKFLEKSVLNKARSTTCTLWAKLSLLNSGNSPASIWRTWSLARNGRRRRFRSRQQPLWLFEGAQGLFPPRVWRHTWTYRGWTFR